MMTQTYRNELYFEPEQPGSYISTLSIVSITLFQKKDEADTILAFTELTIPFGLTTY